MPHFPLLFLSSTLFYCLLEPQSHSTLPACSGNRFTLDLHSLYCFSLSPPLIFCLSVSLSFSLAFSLYPFYTFDYYVFVKKKGNALCCKIIATLGPQERCKKKKKPVEKLVSGHRLPVCCSSLCLSQALFSCLLLFAGQICRIPSFFPLCLVVV